MVAVGRIAVTNPLLHGWIHAHTHHLTALFPGAGTREVKPIWILLKLQADNHISTPPLSFLQVGCRSCRPTNSVKALKALCAAGYFT